MLDLDNTLWSGAIGDEGLTGIKVGQGSAVGEAHLRVQQMALDLRARGIILAVSSKNEEAVARQPFRHHPDMALREEHISAFHANWFNKADSLEAIARGLNIGLDSLVFLDDNPAERAQMRAALPMVAVPELPSEPCLFPDFLLAAGYFESFGFTREDGDRAQAYQAEAERAQVLQTSRDLGDYLSSLDMTLQVAPFDEQGRKRIVQLIGKSNQFNLTTRRHSESEVARLEADPSAYTMQARLVDRYGDMGMICVIIAAPDGQGPERVWEIDTWLMSCRVLGRKVEEASLGHLVEAALESGVTRLIGKYIPTPKNGLVADHYLRLGFQLVSEVEGVRIYHLDLSDYVRPDLPLKVVSVRPPTQV